MPSTPGSYLRRGSRYVTPNNVRMARAVYSGLRGTRLFSGGGRVRRGGVYRQRRLVYRKSFRKRKMYRRTLPSTRQRSHCISSGLVRSPIEDKLNGTISAFELAIRDTRSAANAIASDGDNYISFRMGTMYFQSIPWPYKPTDGENFSTKKRESNHLNLHGFKIHREFAYEKDEIDGVGPIVVNWAIIQGRVDIDTQELAAALTNNTFREHSSLINETYSFEQYTATGSGANWKGELNYLPLNPDNKFKILTHKRMVLQPKNFSNFAQRARKGEGWSAPNRWEIKKYYKVGKTFSFEDNNAITPQKNIYEVFWYNTQTPDGFPVNPISTSYLTTMRRNQTYYSDTQ